MEVIVTAPQVTYRIKMMGNKVEEYSRFHGELVQADNGTFTYIYLSNPEDLPKRELFMNMEEPISKCEIITPKEYVGNLMQLSQERR